MRRVFDWFNLDTVRVPGVLVPPPGLMLTHQRLPDGTIRLSWPASATASGYILEVAFDLAGLWEEGVWWGFVPSTEGNESVVYVTSSEIAQFFRLRKP